MILKSNDSTYSDVYLNRLKIIEFIDFFIFKDGGPKLFLQ